ncbi:MAG: type II toxin-antitoxin system RelE/ParE family toxin [Bacteroidetes bacterium]|nr:type II toxin-antitoxin system RelE/ParE family toxin [Bacteroidota bacterium]
MKFKLGKKALGDIEKIWLYTVENWSVEQADRYYNLIFDEIEFLTENPLSGKDYSHVRKNYRCSRVQSHLIFYRFATSKEEVEIIRVLHQRMDIENILHE